MDGFTGRQPRILRVEHGFECSRLENALLASAYQRVVPDVQRRVVEHPTETERDPSNVCHFQQLIAKGA